MNRFYRFKFRVSARVEMVNAIHASRKINAIGMLLECL